MSTALLHTLWESSNEKLILHPMIFHITFGLLKSSHKNEKEDFSKPKIVYPETTQGAYFAFDEDGMMIDKTCFMMISKNAKYLQQILSSKLFEVAYKKIFSSIELGEHGYQYNKHALIKLPIPAPSSMMTENISDADIYDFFKLSCDEISYIEASGV